MTHEELLKSMKPEDAEVLRKWHDDDVSTERERGIAESRKKSEEIKKHLTEKNKLRDFLKDTFEFDPDGDLKQQFEDAQEALKAAGGEGGERTSEEFEKYKKETEKTLKAVMADLEKTRAEKAESERKIKVGKITGVLREAMQDVPSAPYVIKDFISSGKVDVDDDGETVVFLGQDGEKLSVAKALEAFRKENPGLVVINQAGGGGSSAGARSPAPGSKQMHYDEWMKLPAVDRAAFINTGGTTYK